MAYSFNLYVVFLTLLSNFPPHVYQNNSEIWNVFPPTSGQIPPTSSLSDLLKWDPHMVYRVMDGFLQCVGLGVDYSWNINNVIHTQH